MRGAGEGMYFDIEASKDWLSAEQIAKGWSSDRKFLIQTRSGERRLLRLSDIGQYDAKRKEYGIIGKYSRLGFAMSAPREFGVCDGGRQVYMLLDWVEGSDLEATLPGLAEKEQYLLGRRAGEILRKIHSVPLDPADVPNQTKREKKLLQLSRYEASDLRIPNDAAAIRYVKENIDQIWRESPCYLHGDFHPGNLIYRRDGAIGVIDFNRWEVGDPWEEFYKLESFGTEVSVPYCIGQIDAYFGDAIPAGFWRANAVYVAQASLFSIKWAERFGQRDIDGMVKRAKAALEHFEGFTRTVPTWYTEEYRIQYHKGGEDTRQKEKET